MVLLDGVWLFLFLLARERGVALSLLGLGTSTVTCPNIEGVGLCYGSHPLVLGLRPNSYMNLCPAVQ